MMPGQFVNVLAIRPYSQDNKMFQLRWFAGQKKTTTLSLMNSAFLGLSWDINAEMGNVQLDTSPKINTYISYLYHTCITAL